MVVDALVTLTDNDRYRAQVGILVGHLVTVRTPCRRLSRMNITQMR